MLDTNVLMHDPTAIFRFQEHDVYLPMVVLEELDSNKKGLSEASRNVRQSSRFLDDLMRDATKDQIDAGLPLPSAHGIGSERQRRRRQRQAPARPGRLFFQTRQLSSALPDYLPGHGADNAILAQTLALQALHHEARVTLVSKDINLRIKAAVVGVHAEDYYSDKTIEDADVLYTGLARAAGEFLGERTARTCGPGRKPTAPTTRSTGPGGHRPARQPVRARGAGERHRGHRAAHRGRQGHARTGARLPQRAAQRLGRERAQSRAEFRAQPAHGSGDRLRHHPRARRAPARRCSRWPPASCRRWNRTASSRSS